MSTHVAREISLFWSVGLLVRPPFMQMAFKGNYKFTTMYGFLMVRLQPFFILLIKLYTFWCRLHGWTRNSGNLTSFVYHNSFFFCFQDHLERQTCISVVAVRKYNETEQEDVAATNLYRPFAYWWVTKDRRSKRGSKWWDRLARE